MSQNENLKAFLDGELSNAESAAIREEIQGNPEIKAELEDLQSIQFAVRTLAKDIKPVGMADLLNKVTKPKRAPWWIRAGGVVAVGAAGFAVFIVLRNGATRTDRTSAETQVAMKDGSALDRAASVRSKGLSQDPTRAMEEAMKVPESGPAPTVAPPNRGNGTKGPSDRAQKASPGTPRKELETKTEPKEPQNRSAGVPRQDENTVNAGMKEKQSQRDADDKANRPQNAPKTATKKVPDTETGTAAAPAGGFGGGSNSARQEGLGRGGASEPAVAPGAAGIGGGGSGATQTTDGPNSKVPGSAAGRTQNPTATLGVSPKAVEEIIVDADDPDGVIAELAKSGWKDTSSKVSNKAASQHEERVLKLNLTTEAKANLLKKLNSLPKVTVKKKADTSSLAKSGEYKPSVADNVAGSPGGSPGTSVKETVIIRVRKKKSGSAQ